ncbi:hypothetical protein GCM10009691_11920 [Brevibacterium picturae]|uniref:Uncharacterized protein n=1 Tax=Brevibacterium picturae TaxID=260553 RepID=A0ABP4M633_9MICO
MNRVTHYFRDFRTHSTAAFHTDVHTPAPVSAPGQRSDSDDPDRSPTTDSNRTDWAVRVLTDGPIQSAGWLVSGSNHFEKNGVLHEQ